MVILVYGMVKREGQGRAGKDTDRILACFGKRRRRAIEQYEGFVGEGIEAETACLWLSLLLIY